MELLPPFLQVVIARLVVQIPLLVVLAVGLGLAIARRHAHPRASRWALLGFGALLFNVVFGVMVAGFLAVAEVRLMMFLGASTVFSMLVQLGGIIALTLAIFADRTDAKTGSGAAT